MLKAKDFENSLNIKFSLLKDDDAKTTELPYIATMPILGDEVLQKLQIHAYRNSNPRRQKRRILVAETDRMEYIANNYDYSVDNFPR
jgi:hypothetical protein